MKEKRPTKKRTSEGKPIGNPSRKAASARPKGGRLGPGELDKLVLGHMRQHKGKAPHTASAIAKSIKRSAGAIANCLARLEKQEKARLARPKPRSYELVEPKQEGRTRQ
jgi:hypothetical protein